MTVSGVIGEFGIRALIGLGGVLPILPTQEVDPWYFRTQALVVLGCAALLGLAGGGWLPWLAVILAWLAFVFWTLGRTKWGRLSFALVAACGLVQLARSTAFWSGPALLIAVDYLWSSVFVAAVYSAMILGHWYLVWPWMSTAPLRRTIGIAAAALAARGVWWGVLAVPRGVIEAAVQDQQIRLLVLAQVGMGFLGVGIGLFLAYRCTQIRSTQSATGILYAATVLALLGELAGAKVIDRSDRFSVESLIPVPWTTNDARFAPSRQSRPSDLHVLCVWPPCTISKAGRRARGLSRVRPGGELERGRVRREPTPCVSALCLPRLVRAKGLSALVGAGNPAGRFPG